MRLHGHDVTYGLTLEMMARWLGRVNSSRHALWRFDLSRRLTLPIGRIFVRRRSEYYQHLILYTPVDSIAQLYTHCVMHA